MTDEQKPEREGDITLGIPVSRFFTWDEYCLLLAMIYAKDSAGEDIPTDTAEQLLTMAHYLWMRGFNFAHVNYPEGGSVRDIEVREFPPEGASARSYARGFRTFELIRKGVEFARARQGQIDAEDIDLMDQYLESADYQELRELEEEAYEAEAKRRALEESASRWRETLH